MIVNLPSDRFIYLGLSIRDRMIELGFKKSSFFVYIGVYF